MTESVCRFSFFMEAEAREAPVVVQPLQQAAAMFQRRASKVEMQPGDEARVKARRVWPGSKRRLWCQAPAAGSPIMFATLHLSLERPSGYFGSSPSQALRVQVHLRALGPMPWMRAAADPPRRLVACRTCPICLIAMCPSSTRAVRLHSPLPLNLQ